MRIELGKKHNIRVTCVQPGAVETELLEQISDPAVRRQMEELKTQMEFLKAGDIADTVLFALQSPSHMDIAEVFVMPTQQAW
jgi:NADP-dependent 3-hydroxy acid dehydrogenase YdfG